jgi:hypothetical protein
MESCERMYSDAFLLHILLPGYGITMCVMNDNICIDHAHASFISTTTKPLPGSATNTDYVTLTMTAFTTTPVCNLYQPGIDVRLHACM